MAKHLLDAHHLYYDVHTVSLEQEFFASTILMLTEIATSCCRILTSRFCDKFCTRHQNFPMYRRIHLKTSQILNNA